MPMGPRRPLWPLASSLPVSAARVPTGPAPRIQRVQQAVQDLAKSGEAGVATFSSQNATSVWKDSYTFVLSCEGETAVTVANPVRAEPNGQAHGTDPHLRPEIGGADCR